MTPEEVIHFFAPHEDSTSTVLHWLQQAGFTEQRVSVSVNKQVRLSNCSLGGIAKRKTGVRKN
jgi:hypothetical protein